MGKRKEMSAELGGLDSGGQAGGSIHLLHKKKHKKHKKHKRRRDGVGAEGEVSFSSETLESDSTTGKPQLKLKIKIGGHMLSTTSVPQYVVAAGAPTTAVGTEDEEEESFNPWIDDSDGDPPALPDAESGPEDEEEKRWLDALERGELDDNGELKKEVDESLLTPRQRALLHRDAAPTQPLLELPMGYKEKEMTAEMLMKRAERARTRRLQAARKAEESRKQTIERLTKTGRAKSGGKAGGRVGALGRRWPMAPTVRYSSSASEGTTVSFPPGFPLPALLGPAPAPPPAPSQALDCGVPGCTNRKRYSCAKTGVPLCSLECYRKNLVLQAHS
ncbi:INO80 complex subunit B [Petromyzon marinus]|uniref:INO80 complex subunit B n=1 Tax=Petromyzon marinus TaxID=7757 RepID=A0AAJ7WT81_PETMA|nr:INO80 complex subunit B [Petromyzon marinus]